MDLEANEGNSTLAKSRTDFLHFTCLTLYSLYTLYNLYVMHHALHYHFKVRTYELMIFSLVI